jgi:S1-C subfamily serine protease
MAVVLLLAVATAPDPLASCAWVRAEGDTAGAGFVVDVGRRHLVTCRHLVADRKAVDVIFPWIRDGELVTDRATYLRNRPRLRELGLLVTGTVRKTSDDLDLALLELDALPPGTRAVTFAPPPAAGDPLRLIGNRLDLDTVFNLTAGPTRASGRLADGYFWRGKKLAANADVLVGQLPTEEGDSGGPVLNRRGELVGVATALRRQCPLAAVCVSAAAVRAFAGLPDAPQEKPSASPVADALTRATVWVRPTATDVHLAGVLVAPDLVVTCGKGLVPGDRVGVAFPVPAGDRWVAERAPYRDPVGLHLRGCWRGARVLAADRGLALLRLDAPVEHMRPLPLAARPPAVGDAVHAMSHPGGLEFAWVYANGAVRQRGRGVLVCQLPAQGGSPGGPVVNDRGELVGVLSEKESAQMVGYAVAADEVAALLDAARPDRPARTLPGLLARLKALPGAFAAAVARVRLTTLRADATLADLDAAVENGPFERRVLLLRSERASAARDWRKARGDLERVLGVDPADADTRRRLVPVLLELGEDAKAAAAVADVLRADPKQLPAVAADLLTQADGLARKFPDAPSVPAGWLVRATTAARRDEFAAALKWAAATKDDAERLAVLRAGLSAAAGKAP